MLKEGVVMEKSLWSREAPGVYSRPEKRHRALLVLLVLLLTFTASPSAQEKDQGASRNARGNCMIFAQWRARLPNFGAVVTLPRVGRNNTGR